MNPILCKAVVSIVLLFLIVSTLLALYSIYVSSAANLNYAALFTAYILCYFAETGNHDLMSIISTLHTALELKLKRFIDLMRFESIPKEYYITMRVPTKVISIGYMLE